MNQSRSTLDSPGGDGERSATLAAAIASGAMIAQHVAGKATRDALFLSNFELSTLPLAMVASAAASTVAVLGVSRAMARYSPARVVPVVFGSSAALFLLEWGISLRDTRTAALAVYFHMAIFGATIVSAFWSLVNERFDPHTAKRLVGRIASGGTLGGVVGGVLAWRASGVLSVPTMLALLAGMNLIALAGVQRVIPRAAKGRIMTEGHVALRPPSGLATIRKIPYLSNLAALVLLGAITQALLDYLLSAHAQATFGKGEHLLAFFALFHMLVGVAAFIVQTTLSRVSLERLGLAWTVALVSAVAILGGSAAIVVRTFAAVVIARASEAVVRNSIFRSAYELLFTPLLPAEKRPTKLLIDVGCDRIGTALGSGIILAVTWLAIKRVDEVLFGVCVLFSAAGIVLALRLHGGYVLALETRIRSNELKLDPGDVFDVTTRRTLSETTVALDREKLLESIEQFQKNRVSAATAEHSAPPASIAKPTVRDEEVLTEEKPDVVLETISLLRSRDLPRIRAVLSSEALLPRALVPHVVTLLQNDALVRDAMRALRRVARRSTGQLLDALLDPDEEIAVRRRLPRVLKVVASRRAVDGLMLGLSDASFEVRQQCALSLLQIIEENPQLKPTKETVFTAAVLELELGKKGWDFSTDPIADDGSPYRGSDFPPSIEQTERPLRGLQHVFTVLSLVLEREPLEIAFRSLNAEDGAIRGTALEYLEVVLPPMVKDQLLPFLGDKNLRKMNVRRQASELEGELLRSKASFAMSDMPKTRQKS